MKGAGYLRLSGYRVPDTGRKQVVVLEEESDHPPAIKNLREDPEIEPTTKPTTNLSFICYRYKRPEFINQSSTMRTFLIFLPLISEAFCEFHW
jgi:hypothetical protein